MHGLPQGSVLEPLLFLICVNDIENINNYVELNFFVDDTRIFVYYVSSREENQEILMTKSNDGLSRINLLFTANKLSLNIEKFT